MDAILVCNPVAVLPGMWIDAAQLISNSNKQVFNPHFLHPLEFSKSCFKFQNFVSYFWTSSTLILIPNNCHNNHYYSYYPYEC